MNVRKRHIVSKGYKSYWNLAEFPALTLTQSFKRHSVCMIWFSLEPNSPLETTGFPELAQPSFSSVSVAALISAEEEFVMGDYLSDSVIRHYSTQKPPVIQIFKICFSHTDCTLAQLSHTDWILCPREARSTRVVWEWATELPRDRILLIIHDRKQNVNMLSTTYLTPS